LVHPKELIFVELAELLGNFGRFGSIASKLQRWIFPAAYSVGCAACPVGMRGISHTSTHARVPIFLAAALLSGPVTIG
jgi:hypothetical protein